MRFLAALCLLAAAPIALSAAAAPASAGQAADAARSAAELAKLVHPIDLAVATAAEGADRYLLAEMLKQPNFADLEKQYPGIMAAMYQAGRPLMLEVERRNAGRVQEVLAAFYQAELTAAEIDAIRGFFSSATGQKITRGMFNPAGIKGVAEVVARDPEAPVAVDTLAAIQTQIAERMAASVTAEDTQIAARFMSTAAGAKMQDLVPRMQAKMAQIVNESHPDLQGQIDSAMETAAKRFIEAAAKK